jgi:hypothetical protein
MRLQLTCLVVLCSPLGAIAGPKKPAAPPPAQATPKGLGCTETDAPDPRCKTASSETAGTVGTGTRFASDGYPDVTGGFVSGDKAYVSVEWGAQKDDRGGIVEVDLKTGNRTLISGKRNEEDARGAGTAGFEDDLGGIQDVKAGATGKLLAYVCKGSTSRRFIIEVDLATGDRKVVWASNFASSVAQKDVEKAVVTEDKLCATPNGPYAQPDFPAMAVDDAGAVYLALTNNPLGSGHGLAKLDPAKGYACERLTSHGGKAPEKGSGFKAQENTSGHVTGLFHEGRSVLMLRSESAVRLVRVDLATGARKRVSDAISGDSIGEGPAMGSSRLGVSGTTAWTAGPWAQSTWYLVSVDLTTGQRTEIPAPKSGSLKGPIRDGSPWLWPLSDGTLLVNYDNALHRFDPKTGDSRLVSH